MVSSFSLNPHCTLKDMLSTYLSRIILSFATVCVWQLGALHQILAIMHFCLNFKGTMLGVNIITIFTLYLPLVYLIIIIKPKAIHFLTHHGEKFDCICKGGVLWVSYKPPITNQTSALPNVSTQFGSRLTYTGTPG